ncbi:Filament-like plant protein [Macleaya cordata]|uniref:Filament-like plant protein n=1 Tax=Macleaya cordata TaxID=56857 RepID=A0A200QLW5_MACCD|nr:Filament-like plant protein [Macleaya cordata]
MDRRSWLWRRKSSEKSPGETESSGSISSHSERYSDDQEQSKASPVHNNQSPEVTSKSAVSGEEVNDNMKNLTDKLSAALLNISAKEDLVKQHAKVAEEAVSGWEKAENEVVVLKQQLDAAAQKNSALEDRVGHLDGALKECVRQLRQAREEQEQKFHEAVVKKTHEWESTKFELESQLTELQAKVEAAKAEPDASIIDPDLDLHPKLEAAEKENSTLKLELLARAEELEIKTLERDLSVQAAETASKQHLESIKKVAKLEADCRRLRAAARKANNNDQKSSAIASSSSIYVESFTDSQSDSGERLLAVETDPPRKMNNKNSVELNECEPSCSDSWASALIAELDQFKKNDKAVAGRNLATASSLDISLMDDFLEMERLAALPETESITKIGAVSDQHYDGGHDHDQSKADLEAMIQRTAELEEKLERMEVEKSGLEMALAESQDRLETSQDQLRKAEEKLVEVQKELDLATKSKQATEVEMESVNAKSEATESQLLAMDAEVRTLRAKVDSLETEIEDERALSAEMVTKCRSLEDELSKRRHEAERRRATNSNGELKIKQEKELAVAAGKLAECQKTIASLGQQLKSLATLEDFMIDLAEKPLDVSVVGGSTPIPNKSGGEYWRLHSNDAYFPKTDAAHLSKAFLAADDGSGPSMNMNGNNGESPPSSSSSSSASSVNHSVNSEKSRNGFSKLFSRSKSGIRIENNS